LSNNQTLVMTLNLPVTYARIRLILLVREYFGTAQSFHKSRIIEGLMTQQSLQPQFEQTSLILRSKTVPNWKHLKHIKCAISDGLLP